PSRHVLSTPPQRAVPRPNPRHWRLGREAASSLLDVRPDIHSGNAPVRRDPPLLSTRLSPSPSQGRAAAETIDVPRHHYIELALGAVLAQRIERRPSIAALSATDAVILVDLRHPPAGPFCRLSQLVLWRGFC